MNELQPDQSYGLSYHETLFPGYQKVPNVQIAVIIPRSVISTD